MSAIDRLSLRAYARVLPVLALLLAWAVSATAAGAQAPTVPTPQPLPDITPLILGPMAEMRTQSFIVVGAALVIGMSFFALAYAWKQGRKKLG